VDSITDSLDTDTVRGFSVLQPEVLQQRERDKLPVIDNVEMKVVAVGFANRLEGADIGINFILPSEVLQQQMKAGPQVSLRFGG
jgi:hypothetical protein